MTPIDLAIFTASASVLLFMPGPTNAVMMASGAASGLRKSLPMTTVALAGYSAAVGTLLLLGALAADHGRDVALVLKATAAVVMAVIAFKLWVSAVPSVSIPPRPSSVSIFALTLFNPKALVLAFGIMQPIGGLADLLTKAMILGVLVLLSTGSWISAGVSTRNLPAIPSHWIARMASVVLACFTLYFLVAVVSEIDLRRQTPDSSWHVGARSRAVPPGLGLGVAGQDVLTALATLKARAT